jgi:hypothetical protein
VPILAEEIHGDGAQQYGATDKWGTSGDGAEVGSLENTSAGQRHHSMEPPVGVHHEQSDAAQSSASALSSGTAQRGAEPPAAPANCAAPQLALDSATINTFDTVASADQLADRTDGQLVELVGNAEHHAIGNALGGITDAATGRQEDDHPPEPPADANAAAALAEIETRDLATGNAVESAVAKAIESTATCGHATTSTNKVSDDAVSSCCAAADVCSTAAADEPGSISSQIHSSTGATERDALLMTHKSVNSQPCEGPADSHAINQPAESSVEAAIVATGGTVDADSVPVQGSIESSKSGTSYQNGEARTAVSQCPQEVSLQSHSEEHADANSQESSLPASSHTHGQAPPAVQSTSAHGKEPPSDKGSKSQELAAEHKLSGANSVGIESAEGSTEGRNESSAGEGVGSMKDMLALGESMSQMTHGWLWGKSTDSDSGKNAAAPGASLNSLSSHVALVPDAMGMTLESGTQAL